MKTSVLLYLNGPGDFFLLGPPLSWPICFLSIYTTPSPLPPPPLLKNFPRLFPPFSLHHRPMERLRGRVAKSPAGARTKPDRPGMPVLVLAGHGQKWKETQLQGSCIKGGSKGWGGRKWFAYVKCFLTTHGRIWMHTERGHQHRKGMGLAAQLHMRDLEYYFYYLSTFESQVFSFLKIFTEVSYTVCIVSGV